MDEHDIKRLILRRRAQFVAAALATVGVSALDGCSKQPGPRACLQPTSIEVEPPVAEDGGDDPTSTEGTETPGAVDGGSDADGPPPKAVEPRICLDFEQ